MKRLTARYLIPLLLAMAGIAWVVYDALLADHKEQAMRRLEAIADLKKAQLEGWLAERRTDVALLANDPEVRGYLSHPTSARQVHALACLRSHSEHLGYASTQIVDARGRPALYAGESGLEIEQAAHASEQHQDGQFVLGLHRHGADRPILLDLVYPVRDADGARLGVLLVLLRPERHLFPLIQHWVGSSETGEVVLGRSDGDEAVLLNELRHRKDAATRHRISLHGNTMPLARALRDGPGRYEGQDYRGALVFTAARSIAGTPWVVLAKIDQAEVYGEVRARAAIIGALAALTTLFTAALAWLYWRRRQARAERTVQEARLGRRESDARFHAIFNTAHDGILVVDLETRRLISANPAMCRLTGYAEAELLSLGVADIHPPEAMPRIQGEFERLLRDGSSHTPDIPVRCRDGVIIAADISASVMEIGGKPCATGIFHDISARKDAEEHLRRKREHQDALRDLLDAILRGDGLHETLERCLDRILAVSWLAAQPTGGIHLLRADRTGLELSVSRNLPPQAWERCGHLALGRCLCGQAAASGETQFSAHVDARHEITYPGMPDHGHYCLPLRTGQEVLGVLMVQLPPGAKRLREQEEFLHDAAGALAAYLQRHRAETALRRSEDSLNRAQAVGHIGSWALDMRANMLTWSAETYRIFGAAPDGPLSYEAFLERVHPDDRAYVHEQWSAAMAGNPYDIEHRIVVGGETRWVNERAELQFDADGALAGGIGMVQDITEKKRISEELERYRLHLEERVAERTAELAANEARTRSILRTMLDGVAQIDTRGVILSVNEAMETLFGYSAAEMVGRNISQFMPEPHHSRHDGYLRRYLETRQGTALGRRLEAEGLRRDGSRFAIDLTINELVDEAGITFIGVLRDITERKSVEAARERARAEAERLAQVKSEFLANMSHEIRTPLNAVLGLARIGLRENKGRRTSLTSARILDASRHLLGVINDILDFSKIEAGKLAVETRPFALTEMLDDAVALVADRAQAKGLALTVQQADGLPAWVAGDPQRVRQILLNLLGNAVKFTEHGEVRLEVRQDGDATLFRVADSGIGMTPEQVSRLFTPFGQGDATTTRRFGGTGLGLSISRDLARLMGGEIEAEGHLGMGSLFTLRLPLPPASPMSAGPCAAETAGPRLAGLAVLAADDVEANRYILEDLLAQEGARVTFAVDGQDAVTRVYEAGADAYDVVLMDIQMPGMDGYEAARLIRELAPDLPIIGLTAHAMAEERQRCLAAGMADHVAKPVETDALVAAIRRQTGADTGSGPCDGTHPATQGNAPGLINWVALIKRFKGRREFVAKLAGIALQSHGAVPEQLRLAAREGDARRLAFLAHNLKGLGGNLACAMVQQQAAETEQAANGGEPRAMDLALHLADALEAMLLELESHPARTSLPA